MAQVQDKLRYCLYARKSSIGEDRQIASIPDQIKTLTTLAKERGLNIVHTFSEKRTAKLPGRPVFAQMLEKLRNGEADGILCWKLNRLSRNPIDGGEIMWLLQQGVIKQIITSEKTYLPNEHSVVMSVEFGMATQFSRDLSVDTKRGLKYKLDKGLAPIQAPVGYLNNKFLPKGEKNIIPDPERFPLVRKLWDKLLTGQYSVAHLAEYADKELGLVSKRLPKCLYKNKFYELFTNPFYYGYFKYGGIIYKGRHKAMISEEEFNKAQVIMGNRSKAHMPQKFSFTGMVRCGECGAMITAENKVKRQKNGNVHFYTFYRCTKRKRPCSQKCLRKEELEAQILDILGRIEIPPEFYSWAIEQLKSEAKKETTSRKSILTAQRRDYDECVKRIDRLLEMRMNEEITPEEFAEKKAELAEEKARLFSFINESDNDVDSWLEKAESVFDFAANAKKRFENGSLDDKKQILAALGSNFILKDQILSISIQKPLLLVEKAAVEVNTIHKALEPVKNGTFEANFDEIYSQNILLGGQRDSNPC